MRNQSSIPRREAPPPHLLNGCAESPDMTPKHPWWKRKRWRALLLLWAVVMYPVSAGPAFYCAVRWPATQKILIAYEPILAFEGHDLTKTPTGRYIGWWALLAMDHTGQFDAPRSLPSWMAEGD